MGHFPLSDRNEYILLVVEYVSKWVEAILTRKNDHKIVISFLRESILSRFGTPKAIINNRGIHFCNRPFASLMGKYSVSYNVILAYHSQSNGQTELANREVKYILEKTVSANSKDWSHKLTDALWAY